MNQHSLKMRAIALHLIAIEADELKSSDASKWAAFGRVIEKLRPALAALTSAAGFRSLLSRALALANDQVRWLRAVKVRADGSLECPDLSQAHPADIVRGEVALIAQLLELLVAFIGEPLTMRLVQDVWPTAPIDYKPESEMEEEK